MPDPIVAKPGEVATPPAQPAQPITPPAAAVKPAVSPSPAALKPGESPAPAEGATVPIKALHEERERRQQLQFELEALKKIAGQNVLFDINGNAVPQPQVAPQQNDFQKQLDQLWETDPRKAVQTELMAAITWYDNVNAAIDYQEAALAAKDPDFNNYRTEVRQYVRSLPPGERGKDGMVALAYYAVRGQKVDSIISKTKAELEAEWLRKLQAGEVAVGLPQGGVSAPPVIPGAVTLTPDQRVACQALGISETDYVKFMKPGGG